MSQSACLLRLIGLALRAAVIGLPVSPGYCQSFETDVVEFVGDPNGLLICPTDMNKFANIHQHPF